MLQCLLKERLCHIVQDKRTKISLFSTGAVGFLSYSYCMLNNINNHDQIGTTPSGIGGPLSLGRWLYFMGGAIAEKIFGTYNVPFLFGLIAIIILGLVSLVLIHIFEIENYMMCFVVSAITVSFPAIATQMFYFFTIHYFTFAILLGVIGVYFLQYFCEEPVTFSKKNILRRIAGVIIAALFFSCSLGIYQAYLPFVAAVLLLRLIQMCLMKHTKWKNIFEYSVYGFISLVLSYIFYRIILKIFLLAFSVELGSYKGIDTMGQLDFGSLPILIYQTYKSYLFLFLESYRQINATDLTKACVLVIDIFCLLTLLFFMEKNDKFKVIELCVFLALLPLASNFSVIMAPEATIYNAVLMGVISIFYLPIVIYEKTDYKSFKIKKFSRAVLSVVIILVVLSYIWLANVNYRSLYYANRKMENYYNTMWTRITLSKGYRENMRVIFIGEQINDESFFECWNMPTYTYDGNTIGDNELNMYSRENFFRNYLGHSYAEITDEEYQKYHATIAAMDTYPNDNSIQVIDDLVLVRLE